MAEARRQKILCPKCRKEIEINVWNTVEVPYDDELREQVLKNTFFRVDCVDCKIKFPVAYHCQYNDMLRKFLLWVAPNVDLPASKDHKAIAEYNEKLKTDNRLRLAQGGYRYRIVRNNNELREKTIIFEEGLDDRYIETMKLVYVPLIKKEIKEENKIAGIYFDKRAEGGYQLMVLFNNLPPMCAAVDMNIYEDMKVKLKDIVDESTPEGLCQIDAAWALKVMMHEMKEKENTEENKVNEA